MLGSSYLPCDRLGLYRDPVPDFLGSFPEDIDFQDHFRYAYLVIVDGRVGLFFHLVLSDMVNK